MPLANFAARFVDALDSRGLVNLKLSLNANAIADYDAVLSIDPKQASSLYGRGIARLRSGQQGRRRCRHSGSKISQSSDCQ